MLKRAPDRKDHPQHSSKIYLNSLANKLGFSKIGLKSPKLLSKYISMPTNFIQPLPKHLPMGNRRHRRPLPKYLTMGPNLGPGGAKLPMDGEGSRGPKLPKYLPMMKNEDFRYSAVEDHSGMTRMNPWFDADDPYSCINEVLRSLGGDIREDWSKVPKSCWYSLLHGFGYFDQ